MANTLIYGSVSNMEKVSVNEAEFGFIDAALSR